MLDDPAPSVTLKEGIQGGTLTFLAIGYVSSPRQVSGVRSDVLFSILDALREAGLTLSPPATTTVAQPVSEGGTRALADRADLIGLQPRQAQRNHWLLARPGTRAA